MFKKNNIKLFIIFYIILFVARFILPYGDEPDFDFRVFELLYSEKNEINPYKLFDGIFNEFDWLSYEGTQVPVEMNFFRIHFTFFFVLILVTIGFYLSKFNNKNINQTDSINNLEALLLSLIFPSVWFHLGVLAEEQYILALFLISILFRNSIIGLLLLGILAWPVDIGNTIVYCSFLMLFIFYFVILKYMGIKVAALVGFIIIILSAVVGMNLLELISIVPVIGEKAAHIYEQYTNVYDINDKYPIYYRPIITFLSIIFMLPISKMLFFPTYILFTFAMILIYRRARIVKFVPNRQDLIDYAYFFSALNLLISFPLILPGFSNAKYYVFVIPFLVVFVLRYFKSRKIYNWIVWLNMSVLLQLYIFYLIG
jgi:hypothetical protein